MTDEPRSHLVNSHDGHNSAICHGKELNPEEEEEVVPIAAPNGVAHPGAEVVKQLHAAIGGGAVLGPQRPHDLAGHAQLLPLPCPQRW